MWCKSFVSRCYILKANYYPPYTQPLRDIQRLAPKMPTASNKWSDEQNSQVVKNLKVAKYLGLWSSF